MVYCRGAGFVRFAFMFYLRVTVIACCGAGFVMFALDFYLKLHVIV